MLPAMKPVLASAALDHEAGSVVGQPADAIDGHRRHVSSLQNNAGLPEREKESKMQCKKKRKKKNRQGFWFAAVVASLHRSSIYIPLSFLFVFVQICKKRNGFFFFARDLQAIHQQQHLQSSQWEILKGEMSRSGPPKFGCMALVPPKSAGCGGFRCAPAARWLNAHDSKCGTKCILLHAPW